MGIPEVNALNQKVITDEQAEFFLDNGFLVVRNVLVSPELQRIQKDMMELVQQGTDSGEELPDYRYGKVLLDCIERRKKAAYISEEVSYSYSPGHEFAVKDTKPLSTYCYPHEDYWRVKTNETGGE